MGGAANSSDRVAAARRVGELVRLRAVDPRRLGPQDYRNAGAKHGIEPAALHAFADVESAGAGFGKDGRAIILYEPHIFSRETRGQWDGYAPAGMVCSYPKWVPAGKRPPGCDFHPYQLDQQGRWGLLAFAAELDFEAALKACSWGSFQILGKNHAVIGYPTAWHMVVAFHSGEQAHLDAALAFLAANDVLAAARKGQWERVITVWNGPGQVKLYLRKFMERLTERRKAYA
jgi:hypothetical protein